MARRRTTVCSWRQYCIAIVPASPGVIFQPVSETGRTSTGVCAAGVNVVLLNGFRYLAAGHDNEYMMIDSTIVRAHQHSGGALKKGLGQAIGRSRGVTEHKDPSHLRCPGQSGGDQYHTGAGRRYQPGRTDARKHRSGCFPRRQSL